MLLLSVDGIDGEYNSLIETDHYPIVAPNYKNKRLEFKVFGENKIPQVVSFIEYETSEELKTIWEKIIAAQKSLLI